MTQTGGRNGGKKRKGEREVGKGRRDKILSHANVAKLWKFFFSYS